MKKAMFSLEVFVKVTFTVMLVAFFFAFSGDIYGAVFGKANDDVLQNFQTLTENIQLMIDKPVSFDSQSMVLFIEKKHYIFGFNGPETLISFGKTTAEYPKKCKEKPCLCVYYKIKNFPDDPSKCKAFDYSVVFHGWGADAEILEVDPQSKLDYSSGITFTSQQSENEYSDYPAELRIGYTHLILGSSRTVSGASGSEEIQSFYIEKFVKDDKIHILVTNQLAQAEIEKRESILGVCPPESDAACLGKRRNSYINEATKQMCYFEESTQKCIVKENIGDCLFDTKITESCLCGSTALKPTDNRYCFKRPFDGKVFVLPFICLEIKNCADYCKAISSGTDDCDSDETYYCELNPCGQGYGAAGNRCQIFKDDKARDQCKAAVD